MSQWFLGVIIGEKAVLTAAHCIVSRSFYAIKVMLIWTGKMMLLT